MIERLDLASGLLALCASLLVPTDDRRLLLKRLARSFMVEARLQPTRQPWVGRASRRWCESTPRAPRHVGAVNSAA